MSTSLINSALDGLAGAALTGALGWVSLRKAKPRRQDIEKAWEKRARELERELAAAHRREVEGGQREVERLERQLAAEQSETRRLQRLLAHMQGRVDDE